MESSGWYTKVFYGKDEKKEKKDEMEKEGDEGAANLS
jgi:hypothetical protein